jgi:hypothetical protein
MNRTVARCVLFRIGMKVNLRNIKLAWKYRRYRGLWRRRYDIAAGLLTASVVGAGILLQPKRINRVSESKP